MCDQAAGMAGIMIQSMECPKCGNTIRYEPALDGAPVCGRCGWDAETEWLDGAEELYAITLWQPWASLIGFKTIETRLHDRFRCLEGKRIAIHAGATYDLHAYAEVKCWTDNPDAIKLAMPENARHLPHKAIVCIAKVDKFGWLTGEDSKAALIDCANVRRYGLWLDDLELGYSMPIPGSQGIWKVVVNREANEARRA